MSMFNDFRLSYTHLGLLTGLSPYPPILHVYYMLRECLDVSGVLKIIPLFRDEISKNHSSLQYLDLQVWYILKKTTER